MRPLDPWEARWAAYDEPTYRAALSFVRPTDIILDIGAGTLQFARLAAKIARQVYAVEVQAGLLSNQLSLPDNLVVICADARTIPWPNNITLGVLLMRHCTHFRLYATWLLALGCERLVTNARWRMGVELVPLTGRRQWQTVSAGWYACLCGATGFIETEPALLTEAHLEQVVEVASCPECVDNSMNKPVHTKNRERMSGRGTVFFLTPNKL
jgi:hypothetical protein